LTLVFLLVTLGFRDP